MKHKEKARNFKVYIYVFLALLILVIILAYSMNKRPDGNNGINKTKKDIAPEQKENLIVSLEWKDPAKITPSGGRYELCSDGLNKGNIWMDLTIDNIASDVYIICKDEVTASGESIPIDFIQWNIGLERHKSGNAANGRELKKDHTIKVCCISNDKSINICKEFTIKAYC